MTALNAPAFFAHERVLMNGVIQEGSACLPYCRVSSLLQAPAGCPSDIPSRLLRACDTAAVNPGRYV